MPVSSYAPHKGFFGPKITPLKQYPVPASKRNTLCYTSCVPIIVMNISLFHPPEINHILVEENVESFLCRLSTNVEDHLDLQYISFYHRHNAKQPEFVVTLSKKTQGTQHRLFLSTQKKKWNAAFSLRASAKRVFFSEPTSGYGKNPR